MVKETANVRDVLEICRDQVALCKVKTAMKLSENASQRKSRESAGNLYAVIR